MITPTFEDWLSLLPLVVDRGWRVDRDFIRDRDERCPICALAHELSSGSVDYQMDAFDALEELDIGAAGAIDVLDAADLPGNGNRHALMQALGMEAA